MIIVRSNKWNKPTTPPTSHPHLNLLLQLLLLNSGPPEPIVCVFLPLSGFFNLRANKVLSKPIFPGSCVRDYFYKYNRTHCFEWVEKVLCFKCFDSSRVGECYNWWFSAEKRSSTIPSRKGSYYNKNRNFKQHFPLRFLLFYFNQQFSCIYLLSVERNRKRLTYFTQYFATHNYWFFKYLSNILENSFGQWNFVFENCPKMKKVVSGRCFWRESPQLKQASLFSVKMKIKFINIESHIIQWNFSILYSLTLPVISVFSLPPTPPLQQSKVYFEF